MPNHVANRIYIPDSEVEIRNYVKGGRAFDFNKIKPMPPELDIEASTLYEYLEYQARGEFKKVHWPRNYRELSDTEFLIFIQTMRNYRRFGYGNWYKWCIEYWGTKWNAYSVEETSQYIYFETAWATPKPIFRALSEKFSDFKFVVEYAAEDTGNNCGVMTWLNGVCNGGALQSYSYAAYELNIKLWPEIKDRVKFIDGQFVWSDS